MVQNLWVHNLPNDWTEEVENSKQLNLPPRNVVLPPGNTAKYHAYAHIPRRGLVTDCGKIVTNSWQMGIKDRFDFAWAVDRELKEPCNKCRRLSLVCKGKTVQ